jgi:hypothetical protein
MDGHQPCPKCGQRSANRAVTTYDYSGPNRIGQRECQQIDTFYCSKCHHTWDSPRADAGAESTQRTAASSVASG